MKKGKEEKGNTNKMNAKTGEGKKESKKKVKFPCKLCQRFFGKIFFSVVVLGEIFLTGYHAHQTEII